MNDEDFTYHFQKLHGSDEDFISYCKNLYDFAYEDFQYDFDDNARVIITCGPGTDVISNRREDFTGYDTIYHGGLMECGASDDVIVNWQEDFQEDFEKQIWHTPQSDQLNFRRHFKPRVRRDYQRRRK